MGGLKAGVSVNYSLGRGPKQSGLLYGLPEISSAAVVSGFLTYDFRPFSVGIDVNNRLGSDGGVTVALGGDYTIQPLRRLQVSLGPKVILADRQYEKTFFGVSGSSAARATALGNPMQAYDATAGVENVELSVNARYTITERWFATVHVGLSELVGSAADSPLTQRKFQPSAAAGVIYRF
jgi:outer membrane scaffolding protein for murein synthesis (MipA/OmpV family)